LSDYDDRIARFVTKAGEFRDFSVAVIAAFWQMLELTYPIKPSPLRNDYSRLLKSTLYCVLVDRISVETFATQR
jgi:hypothetical protein